MANKSKMACNKPMKSDRPGKKKMVKVVRTAKKNLYTLAPLVMVIIILLQLVKVLEQDISVDKQNQN